MECLRDYIGLLGCKSSNPGSGLVINSLPGISLKALDMIADSEQVTYAQVWQDIQTRALKKLETDINTGFKKRFRLKSIRDMVDIGRIVKSASPTAMAGQLRGFVYQTNITLIPDYLQSNLQAIAVDSLSLYLIAVPASAFYLKLIDLETGETLWSKQLNTADNPAEEGWNTVSVERTFRCNILFAAYDSTEINSAELDVKRFRTFPSWQRYNGCSDCNASVRGALADDINDPTVITYSTNSYGLSGKFSVTCSYEPFVCANKQSFVNPLWYLLGVETCVERLYSERMNWWTLNDESVDKLKNYFNSQYDNTLEVIIGGIDLNLKDACLDCHDQVIYKETLP